MEKKYKLIDDYRYDDNSNFKLNAELYESEVYTVGSRSTPYNIVSYYVKTYPSDWEEIILTKEGKLNHKINEFVDKIKSKKYAILCSDYEFSKMIKIFEVLDLPQCNINGENLKKLNSRYKYLYVTYLEGEYYFQTISHQNLQVINFSDFINDIKNIYNEKV